MSWINYFNFFLYRYYQKKQESPILSTSLIVALFAQLNGFSLLMIYELLTDFWTIPNLNPNYKLFVIAFVLFVALLNYYLLYFKERHIQIFNEFKNSDHRNKRRDLFVRIYIVLSVTICLLVLIIVDLRNHNFELYFLK
jgi:hypothetical protein